MYIRKRAVVLILSIICFLFSLASTVLGEPGSQAASPQQSQVEAQPTQQPTSRPAASSDVTGGTQVPAGAQDPQPAADPTASAAQSQATVTVIPQHTEDPVAVEPSQELGSQASAPVQTVEATQTAPVLQAKNQAGRAVASSEQAGTVQTAAVEPDSSGRAKASPQPGPVTEPLASAPEPVHKAEAPKPKPSVQPRPKPAPQPLAKAQPAPKREPGLISRIVSATKGLVGRALSWLGTRYIWGGASARGVDCSGLTQLLYRSEGVKLPHNAKAQFKLGQAVARMALAPGDLVFFNTRGPLTHVGMYIGGNKFVHAANRRRGVRIDSLGSSYYNSRYAGARRYKNLS